MCVSAINYVYYSQFLLKLSIYKIVLGNVCNLKRKDKHNRVAMCELLQNPRSMEKIKEELRIVVGVNKKVEDSDY